MAAAAASMRCRCARRAPSWTRWIPRSTRRIEYFIDQQGKWLPQADPARTGRPARDRRGLPGAARHLRRGRHGAGPARTGRPALRRRGRAGVRRLHGQGDDETCLQGTDVAGCRLRDRCARTGRTSTRSASACRSRCSSSRPISGPRWESRRRTTARSWRRRSSSPRSTTAR